MSKKVQMNIYRPFAGALIGTLYGSLNPLICGQRLGSNPPPIFWTHSFIWDPLASNTDPMNPPLYDNTVAGVSPRDGCARVANTSQLAFVMGDGMSIQGGTYVPGKFAVVYVQRTGTMITAYLCRDAVDFVNGGPA